MNELGEDVRDRYPEPQCSLPPHVASLAAPRFFFSLPHILASKLPLLLNFIMGLFRRVDFLVDWFSDLTRPKKDLFPK